MLLLSLSLQIVFLRSVFILSACSEKGTPAGLDIKQKLQDVSARVSAGSRRRKKDPRGFHTAVPQKSVPHIASVKHSLCRVTSSSSLRFICFLPLIINYALTVQDRTGDKTFTKTKLEGSFSQWSFPYIRHEKEEQIIFLQNSDVKNHHHHQVQNATC